MSYRKYSRNNDRRKYARSRFDDGSGQRKFHRPPPGPKKYEDWAWQLDFLPNGYMDDPRPKNLREPLLQVIGEKYFSLLEIKIDKQKVNDFDFKEATRLYIGKDETNKVGYKFKRIDFEKLTINAKAVLPRVIEGIIDQAPSRFLDFFNKSQPITNRMHQLELLPGIGKKTMWAILDARKRKLFDSFDDVQERTSITNPKSLIVKRILKELEDREEKHYLFVRH
ncbi:MAG: DUF655 domain-containing protein [Promethearchaeota archaeon]